MNIHALYDVIQLVNCICYNVEIYQFDDLPYFPVIYLFYIHISFHFGDNFGYCLHAGHGGAEECRRQGGAAQPPWHGHLDMYGVILVITR